MLRLASGIEHVGAHRLSFIFLLYCASECAPYRYVSRSKTIGSKGRRFLRLLKYSDKLLSKRLCLRRSRQQHPSNSWPLSPASCAGRAVFRAQISEDENHGGLLLWVSGSATYPCPLSSPLRSQPRERPLALSVPHAGWHCIFL